MLSPKARRNLKQILPYGIIWVMFALIYILLEKGLLGDLDYYPATGNPYLFGDNVSIIIVSALISGWMVGTIEIVYLQNLFSKKSFGKKIVYKTVFYFFLLVILLIVMTVLSGLMLYQTGFGDQRIWNNLTGFVNTFSFWSVVCYMASITGISQFYTEVSNNLGVEVLQNLISGKYHQPIEEERIFMFLDMRSSTTIAEKLGHKKYFEYLDDYYADLSPPIVNFAGEIYQYAGDEIIVSWTIKNGIKNNNFLRCFQEMKRLLLAQNEKYISKYGVIPKFKAGFHVGMVTAGEIGIIKKEIIFTGDVLNTTARIQGLCNTFNLDNLMSGNLYELINNKSSFNIRHIGEQHVKGRDKSVDVYTLDGGKKS